MNFHYYNKFSGLDNTNMIGKKKEEPKEKEEEMKKGEEAKPTIIIPKAEKVTANADELITNYILGAMLPKEVQKSEAPKADETGEVPPEPKIGDPESPKSGDVESSSKVPANVQMLIDRWEREHEGMDYQQKMNLLTQIINAYGDNEAANIWRITRFGVNREMNTQIYLEFAQQHPNGGYNTSQIPPQLVYEGFSDDFNVYNHLIYNQLSPEEESSYFDTNIKSYSRAVMYNLLCLKAQNPPSNIRSVLLMDINSILTDIDAVIFDPFNANEPWQGAYANFNEKLTNLKNTISELSPEEVVEYVNGLTGLINELRDQGFPYCDNLLIAIQGYIACFGHNEPDILPYPENNGGNGQYNPTVDSRV